MTDFTAWDASTHTQVLLEDDWNNLLAHGLFKTPVYIIRKTGSYYEAISGSTGKVSYGGSADAGGATGTDLESVFEAAEAAAAGGWIHFADGDYSILDELDITQSGTLVTGSGKGTKLTQATADKHGFKVTTKTDVHISNLYLYGTGADAGCGVYATTTATDLEVDHLICENWGYHGIAVVNCGGASIHDNTCKSNIRNGVFLDTVLLSSVVDNKVLTNTRHGIELDDCAGVRVSGNIIYGNDSADTATYDGVYIANSAATCDYNVVEGNTLIGNDRYEVNVGTASCTGNYIGKNQMSYAASDHEGYVSDVGTRTKLRTFTIPFTSGTTFLSAAGAAWGYEIDANLEYALATATLPLDLHQVVRWKIYAQSIVAEADAMRLEVVGQGGGDNEAYNAEAVAVADLPSVSVNFAGGDWIYWEVDAGDDADVDDFVAGDHIQIKVLHEAAGGADCETDAAFTCVVIEYV